MNSGPTLNELEQAARIVLTVMKAIPALQTARVAIIGGMALWYYINKFRTTTDVDLFITAQGAPKAVKDMLKTANSTLFNSFGDIFCVKVGDNWIQVDILPHLQLPYVPGAAVTIRDFSPSEASLPYITAADLLIFKIYSCGLRGKGLKQTRDARDAKRMLAELSAVGNLHLSEEQKTAARIGLKDFVNVLDVDEEWWKKKLGL